MSDPLFELHQTMSHHNHYTATISSHIAATYKNLSDQQKANRRVAAQLAFDTAQLQKDRLDWQARVEEREREFAQREQDHKLRESESIASIVYRVEALGVQLLGAIRSADPTERIRTEFDRIGAVLEEGLTGIDATVADAMVNISELAQNVSTYSDRVEGLQEAVEAATDGMETATREIEANTTAVDAFTEGTGDMLLSDLGTVLHTAQSVNTAVTQLVSDEAKRHAEVMDTWVPSKFSFISPPAFSHCFTDLPTPKSRGRDRKRKYLNDNQLAPCQKRRVLKEDKEEEVDGDVFHDALQTPSPVSKHSAEPLPESFFAFDTQVE
jgi:hypothetical protein